MKIKRVFSNNRKKNFVLETKDHALVFPYSELKIKPSGDDPIVGVYVDVELANEGFTYTLRSGKEDSVLIDEVLHYNQDPEYLREQMLHELTAKALRALNAKKISKRELARKLKTSPRHLYRLLDPAFYGKTIDQMARLLHALGLRVELRINKDAA